MYLRTTPMPYPHNSIKMHIRRMRKYHKCLTTMLHLALAANKRIWNTPCSLPCSMVNLRHLILAASRPAYLIQQLLLAPRHSRNSLVQATSAQCHSSIRSVKCQAQLVDLANHLNLGVKHQLDLLHLQSAHSYRRKLPLCQTTALKATIAHLRSLRPLQLHKAISRPTLQISQAVVNPLLLHLATNLQSYLLAVR